MKIRNSFIKKKHQKITYNKITLLEGKLAKPYFILIFLVVFFFFIFDSIAQNDLKKPSNNQLKITNLLKTIEGKARFSELPFLINYKGVDYYQEQLSGSKNFKDSIEAKSNIATQILLSGKTEEAINYIESILPEIADNENFTNQQYQLLNLNALAFLRLGEELNCIVNHSSESCIYPIQGNGIYSIKWPTRKAIQLYERILEKNKDFVSRWLLNIAYMTLGTYPDSVPKKYYIPYDALDSDYKVSKFKDVSAGVGINVKDYAGGIIVDDFNNDGYLDLFMDAEGFNSPCKLFVNDKNGAFDDKTSSMGLDDEIAGRVAVQADFNNDGFLDIFVCRGAWLTQIDNLPPSSLFKNNGDGTFSDITIEAGLFFNMPVSSASWGDYDNDGWLDLFVGCESMSITSYFPSRLYHNNKDGTFTEVAKYVGIESVGFTKSVSWGDYNNDGWIDLYISNLGGDNFLFKNLGKDKTGNIRFSNETSVAGVSGPKFSFPAFFMDFDNDGWQDIFIAVHTGTFMDVISEIPSEYLGKLSNEILHPVLYKNNRDGTFSNIANEVGLYNIVYAMSCTAGDIDNDGFLDIYAGTGFLDLRSLFPNVLLRNNNGKKFQNITTSAGLGHLQKGHGIGFGDVDNDGDQDIAASLGGAFTTDIYNRALFENPGNSNHWITLNLKGTKSNKSAIGARIKIITDTPGGKKEIYSSVASLGSFGNSCLRREIGLGNANSIESIEITWPASGTIQKFLKPNMNSFYEITEGINKLNSKPLKKIKLTTSQKTDSHHE